MGRRLPAVALGAYVVALGLLVLSPVAAQLNRLTVRLYVVWTYDLGLPGKLLPEDFGTALNVLLFVPVGVLLALVLRRPWWVVTLLCVGLSAAVEVVQLVPSLGRDATVGDVVANGIGGLVGALLAAAVRARSVRGARSA